jgi:hypothetical protein
MSGRVKAMLALGLLALAPACFAQYTLELTAVDFNTESYLNKPWIASLTAAGALSGTEKFQSNVWFMGVTYTAAQAYDAAGRLANGLISNPGSQIDYSFAIWNIFDAQSTDPAGGALV